MTAYGKRYRRPWVQACSSCSTPTPDEDLFPYVYWSSEGKENSRSMLCSACLVSKTPDARHPQFERSPIPQCILDAFPGTVPLPDAADFVTEAEPEQQAKSEPEPEPGPEARFTPPANDNGCEICAYMTPALCPMHAQSSQGADEHDYPPNYD